ncbi:MAG: DUF11 domain-containing protein, partial [Acidobacteria bacterium]|nr:DUF11 domain-containing protein [Acidobacteriota bacterium]
PAPSLFSWRFPNLMRTYKRATAALLALTFAAAPATAAAARPGGAPAAQAQRQQDPETEQVLFERARNLYARGKYDEAVTILTEFLKTYPDSMITDLAMVWLARAYLQQGRVADAEAVGERLRQMKDSPFIAIFESDLQAMRGAATAAAAKRPTPSPESRVEAAEATPTPAAAPAAHTRDRRANGTRTAEERRDEFAGAAKSVQIASTQPAAIFAPGRAPESKAAEAPAPARAAEDTSARVAPAAQPGAFKLTIRQVPDLTLALRRAAEVAYPGQQVQMPVTVTNTGNKEDKFRLQTDLPAEYQPTFTLAQSGLNTGLPIVVTPHLARGASAEVVLSMRVPESAADGQSQGFQVRATSESDYNVVRLTTGTVTVHAAALSAVSSINGRTEAPPGGAFRQTIVVTNTGNSTARDTRADFILNPEYDLVGSEPAPARYDRGTRTAVWSPGDRVYVPVAVRNTGNAPDSYEVRVVAPGAPAATVFADTNGDGRHQETEPAVTRTDTISPQGGQYQMLLAVDIARGAAGGQQYAYNLVSRSLTPGPAVASETSTVITVATPRLRVRTEQITESASPGDLIYYRLTLINEGNGLAKDIVVSEQLAGGLDFVTSEPKVKESKGTLTWKVEDLAPGNTVVLLISARVNPNLQADSTLPARHSVQYKDINANPYQSQ